MVFLTLKYSTAIALVIPQDTLLELPTNCPLYSSTRVQHRVPQYIVPNRRLLVAKYIYPSSMPLKYAKRGNIIASYLFATIIMIIIVINIPRKCVKDKRRRGLILASSTDCKVSSAHFHFPAVLDQSGGHRPSQLGDAAGTVAAEAGDDDEWAHLGLLGLVLAQLLPPRRRALARDPGAILHRDTVQIDAAAVALLVDQQVSRGGRGRLGAAGVLARLRCVVAGGLAVEPVGATLALHLGGRGRGVAARLVKSLRNLDSVGKVAGGGSGGWSAEGEGPVCGSGG